MNKPNFSVSAEDARAIARISGRYEELCRGYGLPVPPRVQLIMDLTACHANGTPLKLDELHNANKSDFAHDVGGILRHINRETGQLGDCFVPRYAKRPEDLSDGELAALKLYRVLVESRTRGAIGAFEGRYANVHAVGPTEAGLRACEVIRSQGFETRNPASIVEVTPGALPEGETIHPSTG